MPRAWSALVVSSSRCTNSSTAVVESETAVEATQFFFKSYEYQSALYYMKGSPANRRQGVWSPGNSCITAFQQSSALGRFAGFHCRHCSARQTKKSLQLSVSRGWPLVQKVVGFFKLKTKLPHSFPSEAVSPQLVQLDAKLLRAAENPTT